MTLSHTADLRRTMVIEPGMNAVRGRVCLATDMQANYLSQQFGLDARVSQETATLVDVEIHRILEGAVEDESRTLMIGRKLKVSYSKTSCVGNMKAG